MSPKGLLALAVATIVSLGLAAYAVANRDLPVAQTRLDRPFLPELAARVGDVARITVRVGGTTMTARRAENGWVLEEKQGYPVELDKVRELVLGLAQMRLVEAKTSDPERLARLELESPDTEGAKSREITLADADGNVLAKVVIGKRKFSLYGPGKSGSYVRLAEETQAWLADRALDVPEEPLDWFDRTILSLPRKDVAEVVLRPDSPDEVRIERTGSDNDAFALAEVPEGREPDASKPSLLAGTLGNITMLDLAAAEEKPLPEDAPIARFTAFDGLQVEARVGVFGEGDDAEYWIAFTAREVAPRERPKAAEDAEGEARADDEAAAKEEPRPVAERVAALQERLEGRVFKVSPYLAKRLLWRVEDLLKEPDKAS